MKEELTGQYLLIVMNEPKMYDFTRMHSCYSFGIEEQVTCSSTVESA